MTIKRYLFNIDNRELVERPEGILVLYDDHVAEMAAAVKRIAELTEERDQARMERNLKEIRLYETQQERDAARSEVEKVKAQRETMLGDRCPFTVLDCLRQLSDAVDILLVQKGYDGHGHEVIALARDWARDHAKAIDAALAAGNDRGGVKGDSQ